MIPGIADLIIQSESNSIRFERFCSEICERSENITLVSTSASYDRGRDARSIAPTKKSHAAIVCCSLDKDLDEKAKADLRRVTRTSDPERLIYCSSQKISEDKADRLEAELRTYLRPSCSVAVLGADHLAQLADRFPEIFIKFYQAEVSTIEARLTSFQSGEEKAETKGLRLALVAFGSEDAKALRSAITKRAILEVLRLLNSAEAHEIATKLSTDLGLPKSLSAQFTGAVLNHLGEDGLVIQNQSQWSLTEQGRKELESIPVEAARGLLAGKALIRSRLEELTGVSLDKTQFDTIWSTLLDFLSELFYSNGLFVIQAIDEFLAHNSSGAPQPSLTPQSNLEKLLADGARKVSATIVFPQLREEVEQAIHDMFTERSGPAFEWLAGVCERFVVLCALGMESTSADEIRKLLLRNQAVLDSDIVLTVLCEGESDHNASRELTARWRRLGGKFLLAKPVLEEVAYHAWISERDFDETSNLLGKLRKDELGRYIENAFVRAFYHVAGAESQRKNWRIYINQFRGALPTDFSNLLGVLQTDLGAGLLPTADGSPLEKELAESLLSALSKSRRKDINDLDEDDIIKSKRDATLLASIAAQRSALRQVGSNAIIVLLSSSGRLRRVEARFRPSFGSPPAVMTLGAFSYLLSMLPDVEFGAGTLRRALFEFGETAHLPDTERVALRVIKGYGDIDLPWARRRTLQDHLQGVLHSEATARDQDIKTVQKQFVEGRESLRPTQILVDALQRMALQDGRSQELEKARRTITLLQSEVEELQRRLISLRGKSN